MAEISQNIRILCQNSVIKGSGDVEGEPVWRSWSIKLAAVDSQHREQKGKLSKILDRVEYILHPTFEKPPQVKYREPYLLQEKGWGEFDLNIVFQVKHDLAPPQVALFDLHFRESSYYIIYPMTFVNPPPELIELLNTPVPVGPPPSSNTKKRRVSPAIVSDSQRKIKTLPPTPGYVTKLEDSSHLYAGVPSTPSYITKPRSTHLSSPLPSFISPNGSSPFDLQNIKTPYDHTSELDSSRYHNEDDDARRFSSRSNEPPGVVDDVYDEGDLERVNSIHSVDFDTETRQAWGIPEHLSMIELARRISRMTTRQKIELLALVRKHRTNEMTIEESLDEFVVDLYSLGSSMLTRLWEYTNECQQPTSNVTRPPKDEPSSHGDMKMTVLRDSLGHKEIVPESSPP